MTNRELIEQAREIVQEIHMAGAHEAVAAIEGRGG